MGVRIPFRPFVESESRRVIICGRQSNVRGKALLSLAYLNDIWRNMDSTIKLFADDCVIYRKIMNDSDVYTLQVDLDRLGEWAVENAMKINPALSFTRARVKDPLNYFWGDRRIPEANSCRYLGIILRSDFGWDDEVNYTAQKAWKVLDCVMRVLQKGKSNKKSLAYM
jgi:hypothetical protein